MAITTADRYVQFGIEVDDSQLNKLDKSSERFGALENSTGGVTSQFNSLRSSVSSFATTLGSLALVKITTDMALLAARAETLQVVMGIVGNNAGYTAAQMDAFDEKVQKQGITIRSSRESLAKMAQSHIDLAKATDLARIAQDAAVIAGENSSETFSKMIYGIQSGQVDVLRTIGINVNFEQSYQKLSRALGKNANDLTELEKIQARTNAVMERAADISGAYESAMGTAGKQVTSLSRYVEDLKVELGDTFRPVLADIIHDITSALKGMNDEIERNRDTRGVIGGALQDVYDIAKAGGRNLQWMGAAIGYGATGVAKNTLFGESLAGRTSLAAQLNAYYAGQLTDIDMADAAAWSLYTDRNNPTVDPQMMRARLDAEQRRIAAGETARRAAMAGGGGKKSTKLTEDQRIDLRNAKEEVDQFWRLVNDEVGTQMAAEDFSAITMGPLALMAKQPGQQKFSLMSAWDLSSLRSTMTGPEQQQFDQAASLSEWEAERTAYRERELTAEREHAVQMGGIQQEISESRLNYLGRDEEAINAHYDFQQQKLLENLDWTLQHTALEESEKIRIKEEYGLQAEQLETERAQRLADTWWNSAQTYVNFAQQMTTMGLQMLLFEEGQRSQIGKRMLATSIRFIAQGLQAYMMGKAKEHLLAAASAAGKIQTDTTAAVTNATMLSQLAWMWTAFYTAQTLNPYGGEAYIPAATAMGAAAGSIDAGIAALLATGATGIGSELALAGAWAAGGIAVGALGEAGASAIEGGTAGSTTPAGYGAGSPGSPVITQPTTTTSGPSQITVVVQADTLIGDKQAIAKWLEEDFAPMVKSAVSRNIDFGLTPA